MTAHLLGNRKQPGVYPPARAGSNSPYHGTAGFYLGEIIYVEFVFQDRAFIGKGSNENN